MSVIVINGEASESEEEELNYSEDNDDYQYFEKIQNVSKNSNSTSNENIPLSVSNKLADKLIGKWNRKRAFIF